eukprot:5478262-Pyramimonas_sp.AAC.1
MIVVLDIEHCVQVAREGPGPEVVEGFELHCFDGQLHTGAQASQHRLQNPKQESQSSDSCR